MGTPFSQWPTVLEPARAAASSNVPEQGSAAADPGSAPWSDPRDLVARAFALLAEEADAWQQRQRADLLPGIRR